MTKRIRIRCFVLLLPQKLPFRCLPTHSPQPPSRKMSERTQTDRPFIITQRIFTPPDSFKLPTDHRRSLTTGPNRRMPHRKWRETKLQPSRASSGNQISCSLVSLHFLHDILQSGPVHCSVSLRLRNSLLWLLREMKNIIPLFHRRRRGRGRGGVYSAGLNKEWSLGCVNSRPVARGSQ